MLLNCGVGEDSWEYLRLQGDPTSPSWGRSVLGVHWKDWCWSWNSNTLATSCEELTRWKRPWCWEGLGTEGEGDDRGWDGWMVSPTQWTWVWINSGSWWWTGKPGVLQFMGSQRVGHDWATELNWPDHFLSHFCPHKYGTWLLKLSVRLPLKSVVLFLLVSNHCVTSCKSCHFACGLSGLTFLWQCNGNGLILELWGEKPCEVGVWVNHQLERELRASHNLFV